MRRNAAGKIYNMMKRPVGVVELKGALFRNVKMATANETRKTKSVDRRSDHSDKGVPSSIH